MTRPDTAPAAHHVGGLPALLQHAIPDWYVEAACARHPLPDLWVSSHPAAQHTARQACRSCPALARCHDYAATTQPVWGTWGGRTYTPNGDDQP